MWQLDLKGRKQPYLLTIPGEQSRNNLSKYR
jgi:hypothetical protein